MKKLIATILSIIYLATSFGATVHSHYCMDELVYVGLENQHQQNEKCGNCGMEKSQAEGGCCKDDQQLVKGADDQKETTAFYKLVPPSSLATLVRFFEYNLLLPLSDTSRPLHIERPPGISKLAVYLRNCVFLI